MGIAERPEQRQFALAFPNIAEEDHRQADGSQKQTEASEDLESREVGIFHRVIRGEPVRRAADVESVAFAEGGFEVSLQFVKPLRIPESRSFRLVVKQK